MVGVGPQDQEFRGCRDYSVVKSSDLRVDGFAVCVLFMAYDFDPRIRSFCIALTAALLLLPGLIARAGEVPQQSAEYAIVGTILDSLGSPIPGVSVRIEKSNVSNLQETTTNELGEFLLSAPTEGTFALRIEKSGFREVIQSVTINRKEHVRLNTLRAARVEINNIALPELLTRVFLLGSDDLEVVGSWCGIEKACAVEILAHCYLGRAKRSGRRLLGRFTDW